MQSLEIFRINLMRRGIVVHRGARVKFSTFHPGVEIAILRFLHIVYRGLKQTAVEIETHRVYKTVLLDT